MDAVPQPRILNRKTDRTRTRTNLPRPFLCRPLRFMDGAARRRMLPAAERHRAFARGSSPISLPGRILRVVSPRINTKPTRPDDEARATVVVGQVVPAGPGWITGEAGQPAQDVPDHLCDGVSSGAASMPSSWRTWANFFGSAKRPSIIIARSDARPASVKTSVGNVPVLVDPHQAAVEQTPGDRRNPGLALVRAAPPGPEVKPLGHSRVGGKEHVQSPADVIPLARGKGLDRQSLHLAHPRQPYHASRLRRDSRTGERQRRSTTTDRASRRG